jgi:hypothetical protein
MKELNFAKHLLIKPDSIDPVSAYVDQY